MDSWELAGRFFGLPVCCIKQFVYGPRRRGVDHFTGSGYIPCDECVKRPKQEVIDEINRHRFCDKPFPKENMKQFKEFMGIE